MIPGAVYRRRNANCNGTRGSRCTRRVADTEPGFWAVQGDHGIRQRTLEAIHAAGRIGTRDKASERRTRHRRAGAQSGGEKLARVPDAVKQASPAQGNDESEVLLPVTCPVCTQQMLTGFRISVIAAALDTGDIRLYSSCHLASWEASDAELIVIPGYLPVLGSVPCIALKLGVACLPASEMAT